MAGILFLSAAVILAVKTAKDMRAMVSRQFNAQQMVIARNIAGRIEREMELLHRELLELGRLKSSGGANATVLDLMGKTRWFHLQQAGVEQIEIKDEKAEAPSFGQKTPEAARLENERTKAQGEDGPWISDPAYENECIRLVLGRRMPGVGRPADSASPGSFPVFAAHFA